MGSTILNYLANQFEDGKIGETLSEIRQRASYPGNYLIVVEGPEDQKVLKELFNNHTFLLNPYCKGRAEMIMSYFPEFKNIIAALDRDYDSLSDDERIFYFDGCNLEMMLVKEDSLFSPLFGGDSFSASDLIAIKNNALNSLKPYSCLRKMNSMKNVGSKCKEFSVEKVFPCLERCLDIKNDTFINDINDGILNNLISLTVKQRNRILRKFTSNLETLMAMNEYDITNGHDFNKIFVKQLSTKMLINTGCYDEHSIYDLYRDSYNISLFSKTKIYDAIREYQNKYNLEFVL